MSEQIQIVMHVANSAYKKDSGFETEKRAKKVYTYGSCLVLEVVLYAHWTIKLPKIAATNEKILLESMTDLS